jgi:hypothetical protein
MITPESVDGFAMERATIEALDAEEGGRRGRSEREIGGSGESAGEEVVGEVAWPRFTEAAGANDPA